MRQDIEITQEWNRLWLLTESDLHSMQFYVILHGAYGVNSRAHAMNYESMNIRKMFTYTKYERVNVRKE